MSNKERYDWSMFSDPDSAFDLYGQTVRLSLAGDAFAGKTQFKARALTDMFPLAANQSMPLDGGSTGGTAANKRYAFKGRIIGANSPHSFLPNPCDAAFSPDDAYAYRVISMHTTFITTTFDTGDNVTRGDIVVVELDRSDFSYNLQYGRLIGLSSLEKPTADGAECANLVDLVGGWGGPDAPPIGSAQATGGCTSNPRRGNPPAPTGVPATAADIEAAYPRIKRRSTGLAQKIVDVANELGIPDPGWLANVIGYETSFSFSASKINTGCKRIEEAAGNDPLLRCAVGLIQFMPSTATSLSTTSHDLHGMSELRQMDKVKRYLAKKIAAHGALLSSADLYMAIFYPKAIGQGPNYSIYQDYVDRKGLRWANTHFRDPNSGICTSGDYQSNADRSAKLPTRLS